jgi:hypothetical protein
MYKVTETKAGLVIPTLQITSLEEKLIISYVESYPGNKVKYNHIKLHIILADLLLMQEKYNDILRVKSELLKSICAEYKAYVTAIVEVLGMRINNSYTKQLECKKYDVSSFNNIAKTTYTITDNKFIVKAKRLLSNFAEYMTPDNIRKKIEIFQAKVKMVSMVNTYLISYLRNRPVRRTNNVTEKSLDLSSNPLINYYNRVIDKFQTRLQAMTGNYNPYIA